MSSFTIIDAIDDDDFIIIVYGIIDDIAVCWYLIIMKCIMTDISCYLFLFARARVRRGLKAEL